MCSRLARIEPSIENRDGFVKICAMFEAFGWCDKAHVEFVNTEHEQRRINAHKSAHMQINRAMPRVTASCHDHFMMSTCKFRTTSTTTMTPTLAKPLIVILFLPTEVSTTKKRPKHHRKTYGRWKNIGLKLVMMVMSTRDRVRTQNATLLCADADTRRFVGGDTENYTRTCKMGGVVLFFWLLNAAL